MSSNSEEEEKKFLDGQKIFDDDEDLSPIWTQSFLDSPGSIPTTAATLVTSQQLPSLKKDGKAPKRRNCLIIVAVTLTLIFSVLVISEMFLYRTHPYRTNNEGETGSVNGDWQKISMDVLSAMNKSAGACQDFYQYSCGNWLFNRTIPSDKSSYIRAWDGIEEDNLRVLEQILTSESPPVSTINKFYESCMDTNYLNAIGIVPLYSPSYQFFQEIDKWLTLNGTVLLSKDIAKMIAKLHRYGINALFSMNIGPSFVDTTKSIIRLDQAPLSLPTRDYYTEKYFENIRNVYVAHVSRVLRLLQIKQNSYEMAFSILNLEIYLASNALSELEVLDPDIINNPRTLFELKINSPNFNWEAYFLEFGIDLTILDTDQLKLINVQSPSYLKAVSASLMSLYSDVEQMFPMEAIQSYIKYRIAASTYPYLDSQLQEEFFSIKRQIYGVIKEEPRKKQCIDITGKYLGELVGAGFIKNRLTSGALEQAGKLVNHIESSLQQIISNAAWMDESTKTIAIDKLKVIVNKVGSPAIWSNFSSLESKIHSNTFFANVMEASGFHFDTALSIFRDRLSENRDKWDLNPQASTIVYKLSYNEITVPAGILQRKFFSDKQPAALNFGAIGSLIGRELIHGFDSSGSKYNKDGRVDEWWPTDVRNAYRSSSQCFIKQYSSYSVVGKTGPFLNGNLTLYENIADNAGIHQAYNAFKMYRKEGNGESDIHIAANFDGLTNDQLFFVAWTQLWCSLYRPDYLQTLVQTDSFSPAKWRAIGPLENFDEFYKAFNCPLPEKHRCVIW